jgi:2,3-bisphosphoglycerate-dependent phosphoglycerate mutase
MMDWLILRHGQSVADIEDRYEGRSDFPLTAAGRAQAERAARWILDSYRFVPEIIIASPLQRARETGVILARRCESELRLDDGLLEMDCGRIAGLPKAEADRRFPVPRGGFRAYQRRGETGESLLGFRARVEGCWLRLTDEAAAAGWERAALVCHGGTINMLFQSF